MAYLRVRGEGGTLFPKDRCVVSFDGTHLAYTIKGSSGPLVALNAGFCCPDNFWRYLAPALARKYRVLIWNYRGMGVSGMPREPAVVPDIEGLRTRYRGKPPRIPPSRP